jgi:hypothetical protein
MLRLATTHKSSHAIRVIANLCVIFFRGPMLYFVCYIFQAPYIATTNFFELVFVFENREKKRIQINSDSLDSFVRPRCRARRRRLASPACSADADVADDSQDGSIPRRCENPNKIGSRINVPCQLLTWSLLDPWPRSEDTMKSIYIAWPRR